MQPPRPVSFHCLAKAAHVRSQGNEPPSPGQPSRTGKARHLLKTSGGQPFLPEGKPGQLGFQGFQPGPVAVPQGEMERTLQEECPVAQFTPVPQRLPQGLEHIVGMITFGPAPFRSEQPGLVDPAGPGEDPEPGSQTHDSCEEGQG